jgi:DNA polymerase-3 subunit beta
MELSLRTQTLSVRCGSYNNNIKCIDAQEFPPLPAIDDEPGITLDMEELREMISQVTFAASSDEARPVLTGVLLEIDGREMTLAAADGFRLSVRKAQLAQAAERSVRAIIPARALAELARIAGDATETVRMVLPANRGQVIFHAESVELVSQLIDGAFPDYKGIIPTGSANRAVVSTEAFLKACKAADIFGGRPPTPPASGSAQAGSWSRGGWKSRPPRPRPAPARSPWMPPSKGTPWRSPSTSAS